ncbi:hypothetical protein A9Q87_12720 [Flavobacteriales bacterium 34_180_T64]|nr:hypothetical protein A9Q87_12720 [Flavobacteriales bacterium 34_180_T64]
MSQNRQLAAIMFTDIEGYTALMRRDEKLAVAMRKRHRNTFERTTEAFNGTIIQYFGDGTLSTFKSTVEAVDCAIELQKAYLKVPEIPVRIGIHVGDIIHSKDDIIGDAVNVASRIESCAVPGSVLISDRVHDQIRSHRHIEYQFLDRFKFKNVETPIPVYAISNEGIVVPELSEVSVKVNASESRSFKSFKKKAAMLLLALVAVIVVLVVNGKREQVGAVYENLSIAVLPFTNMSIDKDSEIFTDGVTEDILLQLSKIKELQVISRTSSMQFKNSEKTIQEIAKALGVSYVLEGSVRKYGDKIRINAKLVNAINNEYLWAENYDETMTEIFDIQSRVSTEIAKALKIELSENEQYNLNRTPTENSEAYRIYKHAQQTLNRGSGKVEDLEKAVALFKESIALDPNFCRAYIGLSDTYLEYIYWGRSASKDVLDNALIPALKALKISPTEGGSYGTLGSISFYRFEKETAIEYLEQALDINPSYVGGYDKLAWIKLFDGHLDDAIALFQKVLELDPLSTKYIADIALSHYYFQNFDKGIGILNEALIAHPNDNMLLWMKGNLLTGNGDYKEAIALFNNRTVGINTNWMLGYAYGMSGQKEKALEILNYQLEKSKIKFVPPYMIAVIYMSLNDKENALLWLEKDYEAGGQGLFFWGLKRDIKFESIKTEPRFIALLEKIK